jgi:phosphohistidine phosphatase
MMRRVLTTAEIIAEKLDCKRSNVVVDDRLGVVKADELLDVIRRLDDRTDA